MSAPIQALGERLTAGVASAAIVLAGFALLMARLVVPVHLETPVMLALLYGMLLAISVSGPAGTSAGVLSPGAAAVLGGGAVVAARLLAGPAVGPTQLAIPFSIVAAVAEEAYFRRFLYDRLQPAGALAAVVVSALLFAVIHIPAYGWGAFPVDLAGGVLLSWQRWASGSWLAPASTHALANILAVIP